MFYLLLLALFSPVLALGLAVFLFSRYTPEMLMQKYAQKPYSVLQRKYPEVDIQSYAGIFLKVGLVLSLLMVLLAFNFRQSSGKVKALTGFFVPDDMTEILPPQTVQPPKTLPPPPPQIELVNDEEVIETEPDLALTEADENTQVEPAQPDVAAIEPVAMPNVPKPVKKEEVEAEPEIFTIVEEMPEFMGGQADLFAFLAQNTRYPAMARENGIEGTVFVGFVVMEDGSISQVHLKRGLPGGGAGIDEEAIRVVKLMPKWKPGKQRGKAVRVAYTLPFKFKLE